MDQNEKLRQKRDANLVINKNIAKNTRIKNEKSSTFIATFIAVEYITTFVSYSVSKGTIINSCMRHV